MPEVSVKTANGATGPARRRDTFMNRLATPKILTCQCWQESPLVAQMLNVVHVESVGVQVVLYCQTRQLSLASGVTACVQGKRVAWHLSCAGRRQGGRRQRCIAWLSSLHCRHRRVSKWRSCPLEDGCVCNGYWAKMEKNPTVSSHMRDKKFANC